MGYYTEYAREHAKRQEERAKAGIPSTGIRGDGQPQPRPSRHWGWSEILARRRRRS